jgi:hypothetical protein
MLEEKGIFGTCPEGQLEGRHIKSYGVNTNSVNDWGFAVGIAEEFPDVIRIITGRSIVPIGISAPSVCKAMGVTAIAIMNVFLSRNRQAVAVQTNDTVVKLGDPVFVDDKGALTTTVTQGWKMGTVASLISNDFCDINGNIGKNGFLLELSDVEWVGG